MVVLTNTNIQRSTS